MNGRRAALAAVASGLLLAAAQPDLSAWPLAWVGLVPLLLAVRGRHGRAAFGLGWLGGMSLYLPVLYWIAPTITNYTRISLPLAAGVLVLLCATVACFVGAFCLTIEWLAAAGIPRMLSAPLAWIAVEWLRTFFPAAFPWALLGYSQYAVEPVVQLADVAGVWGIAAALVFVNAALAEAVAEGAGRRLGTLGAASALIGVVLVYGSVRVVRVEAWPALAHLQVGMVQANVAQDQKWDERLQDDILARYLALSARASDAGAELVVWPEAAVPFFLRFDPRRDEIIRFADDRDVHMLVGAPEAELGPDGKPRQLNSAWLIAPERGLVARYDKIELVPFGEYVPFGWVLGWVDKAVQAVGDFGRGTRHVVFGGPVVETPDGARPARFGALICYEGIFPALTRRFVVEGADFLVNVSNDAWYGRTSAPYQHLAMAAVRAVENRVPLVRSTNTGISAVVDRLGRIRGRTPLFEQAVSTDTITLARPTSVYLTLGDAFVYLALVVLALLAAIRLRAGRC